MRKLGLVALPMSVEMMRASEEFLRRRREKPAVRDTYRTPDPKRKWNDDGTPRR